MSKIQVVFDFVAASEKVDFSAVKYRLHNDHKKDGITWAASSQSFVDDSSIEKLTQTIIIDTSKASIADVEAIAAIHKKDIKTTTVVSQEPFVEAAVAVEEKKALTGKSVAVFDLFGLYDGVDFEAVATKVKAIVAEGVTFTKTEVSDVFDGQKLTITAEIDNTKTNSAAVEKLFVFPDDVDGIVLISEEAVKAAKSVLVFDLFGLYDGVDFEGVATKVKAFAVDGVTFTKTEITDVFDGQKLTITAEIDNTKATAASVEKLFVFPDDVDGIVLISQTDL